ncbi:uncharacterized protein LOC126656889 [Mercurialis annua]|uniref:uncharacterized protein LOC126656889 n=1 Tax=Mercurialis annua TaxID=3986 RepID=UPI0021602C83|nr:uncharacterized protein LOC126656889 [Mercurialis annua]
MTSSSSLTVTRSSPLKLLVMLCFLSTLLSLDKLFKLGKTDNYTCVLCNSCGESVSHLFFDCSFSSAIWKKVLTACGINRSPLRWSREISWFSRKYGGKNVSNKVRRIAFCSTVYSKWQDRFKVVFEGISPSHDSVFNKVRFSILYKFKFRAIGAIPEC